MSEADESLPPGQAPAPPRVVPPWARSPGARNMTLAAIILIVGGLFCSGLFLVLIGTAAADQALDKRGEVVLATPVSYVLSSTSQNGAVQRYMLELTYTDDAGNKQTTHLETNHSKQREAAEAGQPLKIVVDPQNPAYSRWPGQRLNPLGDVLYWIMGMVVALGFVLGALGLIRSRSDRRLYRSGKACPGRIERVQTKRHNNKTLHYLDYSYVTDGIRTENTFVVAGVLEPTEGPIWVVVSDDGMRSIPMLE